VEQEAQALVTACFKSKATTSAGEEASTPGLLSSHAVGILTVEEFLQAKDLCQKCSEKVSSFSRLSMAKAFS
jgi:hypothetical protein